MADPAVHHHIATLLKFGLSALGKYSLKRVLTSPKEQTGENSVISKSSEGSVLIGAIYAETLQITNHINNIGALESIELLPAASVGAAQVKLTSDTQKYVREIVNESYRGPKEEITGNVTQLYPDRLLAEIKLKPGRYVKVGLDEESFRFVRYKTESEEQLRFKGHPIIRLAKDVTGYEEFEAESVEREKA